MSSFTDLAPEHEAFLDAWGEGDCPLPAEPSSTTWNRPPSVWRRRHVMALVAGDSLAMALAAWVADAVRFGAQDGALRLGGIAISYFFFSMLMTPLWVLVLTISGGYESKRLGHGSEEYQRVFDATVRFLAVLAVALVAFQLDVDRGFVVIAVPLAGVLTAMNHHLARRWLQSCRSRGTCVQRVIVVGQRRLVPDLVRHLRRSAPAGFSVVGACLPGTQELIVDGEAVPVLGQPSRVLEALAITGADTVAMADRDALGSGGLHRLGWQLEGTGVDLLVVPSLAAVAGPRISVRPLAGVPLLQVEEPRFTGPSRVLKESFERLVAAVALLLLGPLMAVVALAIWMGSRGSPLFSQVRVGLHGREFVIRKFRTMRIGAESEREDMADRNENDRILFKIHADPRLTRAGKLLRRFSIDEVPQLWNVLKGDMSLVGPRPPLPSEVKQYGRDVRRRLLVKPGLTGLWQVSGRSDLPWEEAVRLDLYYVQNWSLGLDLVILLRTIAAVVHGRGAY